MSAFNIWKENPPPRDTVVMARWALTGDEHQTRWFPVRTCKRGCCMYDLPAPSYGPLINAKYWREPPAEELASLSTRKQDG